MKSKFFISSKAEQDIEEITSYIDLDNPDAGHRFLAAVYETGTLVTFFPRIYPLYRRSGTKSTVMSIRRCPISGFPNFLLYYSLRKDGSIVIQRVIHSAQDLSRAVDESGLL